MRTFNGLTRREFLKLISLVPVGVYSRPLSNLTTLAQSGIPNVIVIVYDAWSQHHVSLYGYPRPTMPNLEKFAERATVYHNHYSPGTYTVTGASSLLTGMHPWTHRAFQLGAGITASHAGHNIFSTLSSTHSTFAYAQNKLADQMLYQFEGELDQHAKAWLFNAQDSDPYDVFKNDIRMAYASLDDNIIQKGEGFDSSLFVGPIARLKTLRDRLRVEKQDEANRYPRGVPQAPGLFFLDDLVDGSIEMLKDVQQPFLAYIHFWPPHHPYTPTRDFFDTFNDGWNPPDKPIHKLSDEKNDNEKLHLNRRYYDEFIASWDHETARLYQYLEESGLRENSYIIITADHGELFERGKIGHGPKLIYDPVIHVPLIISRPGQTSREDVHTITSSVDILPTIAHLTGNPIPAWAEGQILPILGGETEKGRSVFSIDARTSSSFAPLENFSVSITRDGHRLVFYRYPETGYEEFEFYDLETDPDELKDLFPSGPTLALDMKDELLQTIEEFNRPYRRGKD